MAPSANPNARFSTYSTTPSIQPSLAPTYTTIDESEARSSSQRTSTYLMPQHNRNSMASANIHTQPPSSLNTTTSSPHSGDPRAAEISAWSGRLERLRNPHLDAQRYIMNENKTDDLAKLALSAKVERALNRRMVGQDATLRSGRGGEKKKKDAPLDEKRAWEMRAR